MKRKFIAILVGTLVLFIWNAISWMILPFHSSLLKNIPENAIIIENIRKNMPEPGVYHYPGLPENDTKQEWQKVIEKSKKGPVISLLVYLPNDKYT